MFPNLFKYDFKEVSLSELFVISFCANFLCETDVAHALLRVPKLYKEQNQRVHSDLLYLLVHGRRNMHVREQKKNLRKHCYSFPKKMLILCFSNHEVLIF